jgi:hypothetical protein
MISDIVPHCRPTGSNGVYFRWRLIDFVRVTDAALLLHTSKLSCPSVLGPYVVCCYLSSA